MKLKIGKCTHLSCNTIYAQKQHENTTQAYRSHVSECHEKRAASSFHTYSQGFCATAELLMFGKDKTRGESFGSKDFRLFLGTNIVYLGKWFRFAIL